MRLGLIGDVHAEVELLREAIAQLKFENVHGILCTGDIVDGVGSVDACCQLLVAHDVLTVQGNHDRWFLEGRMRELPHATSAVDVSEASREFIASRPSTIELDTPLGRLLLCHGLGANDMAKVGLDDFGYAIDANDDLQELIRSPIALVVNGHTHRPGVRAFPGLQVINAGTLSRNQTPCYLVADFEAGMVTVHELESSRVTEWPLGGYGGCDEG